MRDLLLHVLPNTNFSLQVLDLSLTPHPLLWTSDPSSTSRQCKQTGTGLGYTGLITHYVHTGIATSAALRTYPSGYGLQDLPNLGIGQVFYAKGLTASQGMASCQSQVEQAVTNEFANGAAGQLLTVRTTTAQYLG